MVVKRAMMTAMMTAIALSVGGTAAAPASAQPDLSPLINTTCSYQQVVSALTVQAPQLADELSQYPPAQAKLKRFLASPVTTREQMVQQALTAHPQWQDTIDEKAGTPEGQQAQSVLLAVADTCGSY